MLTAAVVKLQFQKDGTRRGGGGEENVHPACLPASLSISISCHVLALPERDPLEYLHGPQGEDLCPNVWD